MGLDFEAAKVHWQRVRRLRAKGGKPAFSAGHSAEFREFLVRTVADANGKWRDLGHADLAKLMNDLGLMTLTGRTFDREAAREFVRSAPLVKMGFATADEARREAIALLKDVETVDAANAPDLHARFKFFAPRVLLIDSLNNKGMDKAVDLIGRKLKARGFPCEIP